MYFDSTTQCDNLILKVLKKNEKDVDSWLKNNLHKARSKNLNGTVPLSAAVSIIELKSRFYLTLFYGLPQLVDRFYLRSRRLNSKLRDPRHLRAIYRDVERMELKHRTILWQAYSSGWWIISLKIASPRGKWVVERYRNNSDAF